MGTVCLCSAGIQWISSVTSGPDCCRRVNLPLPFVVKQCYSYWTIHFSRTDAESCGECCWWKILQGLISSILKQHSKILLPFNFVMWHLEKKYSKKESSLPPTKGCHEVWPIAGGVIQFVKISYNCLTLGMGFLRVGFTCHCITHKTKIQNNFWVIFWQFFHNYFLKMFFVCVLFKIFCIIKWVFCFL